MVVWLSNHNNIVISKQSAFMSSWFSDKRLYSHRKEMMPNDSRPMHVMTFSLKRLSPSMLYVLSAWFNDCVKRSSKSSRT